MSARMPDGKLVKQPASADEAYELLRDGGSDRMQFRFGRPPEAGKTFSQEAFVELSEQMTLFVGARIMDHWNRRGLEAAGPSEITVDVTVTIDGETYVVPADLVPFFQIDGSLRH